MALALSCVQKVCNGCGETKPADDFPPNRGKCKKCKRAADRAYYLANREAYLDPEVQSFIRDIRTQPCAYCGSEENIEVDHVVPLSRGGLHSSDNLVPACRPCNRSKGARTLDEWSGRDS